MTVQPQDRTDKYDLHALYETSRLLSASLDLDFVLSNLLLTALSKLLVMRGVVLLEDAVEGGHRVAVAKGLRGLESGELVRIAKTDGPGAPPELAAMGLDYVMPIVSGHRNIGILALGKKATGQTFEPREEAFLQSLVQMSANAVHNALMVEELKQANRDLDTKIQQLNTLFDLSQEFNSTIDRKRLVRLFSFALMGQMLIGKYVFLLKRSAPSGDVPVFEIAALKGVSETAIDERWQRRMCAITGLQVLEEDPEWAELTGLGLVLALPIRHQNETCAVLCLGPKMTGQPYGPDDIELLSSLGNLAFAAIQNTYLVQEQIERQRLQDEMRLARVIQERMLPQELPTLPGIDIAAIALPSREVGGDYYDVIRLEGRRILVAIADVTGKGAPAAMLMANMQSCLHVMTPMPMTLEEATAHINRVICKNTDFDKFITFFHGIYNEEDSTFTYVNAGHNPPMLVRADGGIELLEAGGLLLGVMSGVTYEGDRVSLFSGDVVVSFTDGVTEAMGPGNEEFGEERLEAVLRAHRHASAAGIVKAVREAVDGFAADPTQLDDDLTMVVLKVV
jgi:phosphoserine phosphatase RsbU/P